MEQNKHTAKTEMLNPKYLHKKIRNFSNQQFKNIYLKSLQKEKLNTAKRRSQEIIKIMAENNQIETNKK